MSKYIKQDHIGSAVSQLPTKILQTEHGIELVVPVTDVIEIIKNAPSIDIVQCGECKEYYTSMTTHPTPDVTEQDKRNSADGKERVDEQV